MAVTTAMRDEVVELYIALFGRAPDADGLGYWASQYDSRGGNLTALQSVAQDMYNVTAARSYYPLSQTDTEFIAAVYQNVFGRTGDADGLSYWAGRLSSISKGAVVAEMIDAVLAYNTAQTTATNTALDTALHRQGVDAKDLFVNKREVAEYFAVTKALNDLDRASAILLNVTNNTATVNDAKSALDTVGLTISLSSNIDTAIGTTGNDFFSATAPGTLNPGDTLDGRDGTDTIQLVLGNDTTAQPQLNSIEQIRLIANGSGVTLDLSLASGHTSIEVWGTGAGATLGILSAASSIIVESGYGGRLTITFGSQSILSSLTMSSITIGANNASGFELHLTALDIAEFIFQVIGTAFVGTAGANSAFEFGTAVKNFNIQGNQDVNLHLFVNSANSALTISSTGLTAGNLNLTIDALGGLRYPNIHAGTGNDTITLETGVLGSGGTTADIDCGPGNDTLNLTVDSSVGGNGVPFNPNVSNAETLGVTFQTGGTFNASGVSGMQTLNVLLGSGTVTADIINLNSSVTAITLGILTGNNGFTGNIALTYSFISVPNAGVSSDTVTLRFLGVTTAETATFGGVDVNGATNVTVVAAGSNNVQLLSALELNAATSLTITVNSGGVDLTLPGISAAQASSVALNATAGGDIVIGSASFATATRVTLNLAGRNTGGSSANTAAHSGGAFAALSAIRADYVFGITSAGATAFRTEAWIRDDLDVTVRGADVTFSGLHMGDSAVNSSISAITLDLIAGDTGDNITIVSANFGTASSANSGQSLVFNISGSGTMYIGTGGFNATGIRSAMVNASALYGSLTFNASAMTAVGFTVNLGPDVRSANRVALGAGDDTINGGGNADIIEGGLGEDRMRGGGGNDVFVFLSSAGDNADQSAGDNDYILDFSSGDRIVFSGITSVTGLAGYTALGGTLISTASLLNQALDTGAAYIAIYQLNNITYIEISLISGILTDYEQAGLSLLGLDLFGVPLPWTDPSDIFQTWIDPEAGLIIQFV